MKREVPVSTRKTQLNDSIEEVFHIQVLTYADIRIRGGTEKLLCW